MKNTLRQSVIKLAKMHSEFHNILKPILATKGMPPKDPLRMFDATVLERMGISNAQTRAEKLHKMTDAFFAGDTHSGSAVLKEIDALVDLTKRPLMNRHEGVPKFVKRLQKLKGQIESILQHGEIL